MFRERGQNPVLGDTINLRSFLYNSNQPSDPYQITRVLVYFLDPQMRSKSNPEGRILVETIPAEGIQRVESGHYLAQLATNETAFQIGSYIDHWEIQYEETDLRLGVVENSFKIYSDLWVSSPLPLVHDIGFEFSPFKFVSGSKKYLRVDVSPKVPSKDILENYYFYLNNIADLHIHIELVEGEGYDRLNPIKNILVNWASITYRDGLTGYYLLDSTIDPRPQSNGAPWPVGIYNVSFRSALGETVHLSRPYKMQIFS